MPAWRCRIHALGLRAIRYCLAEPQLFLAQLRAILRASTAGRIKILLAMLAHAHEIDQSLSMVKQAKQQLDGQGHRLRQGDRSRRHDRSARGGAGAADVHAAAGFPLHRHQRPDPVHARHRPHRRRGGPPVRPAAPGGAAPDRAHIQAANRGGTPIAVCGEMEGEPSTHAPPARLRPAQFSMHAQQLLANKERVLRTNLAEAQPLAQRVLRQSDPAKTGSCWRN